MFKFLRKYNKWILAVGGVLLMIAFLIPEAITRMSQSAGQSSAIVATVDDGKSVTGHDWSKAQSELQMMQKLGVTFRGLGPIQQPAHWLLLVREAEQAGLVGQTTLTDEELQALAAQSRERNPEVIKDVVSRINGVRMLLSLFENAATNSDRRLQTFAERMMHMCNAELVVIAADGSRVTAEPTEEELQKQFQAYADKAKGEGEMGFGYKLPDRAKLEWLTISAESVRELVRKSPEFNGVALRKHWRRYAPQAGATPDPANPNSRNFPAVDDSGEIPEVVRNDLLNELTNQKLDEIGKFASSLIQRNRVGLADSGGFLNLPEDWNSRKIDFQQLAVEIQKQFGIELPAYVAGGDTWLSWEDVNTLPGIGLASTDKFGQTMGLGALFRAAKEFGGNGHPPIQKHVAGPALRGTDGSVYFFRIIDTDPSRVPTSLDEVRAQVVEDLKRLTDYRRLEEQVAQIESQARAEGLLSVAMAHDTVVESGSNVTICWPDFALNQATNGQPVRAFPYPMPELGSDRKTTEAIVDRALALPKDQPLTSLPAEQTTFVVPVKDQLKVAVVRLTGQNPLTKEMYTRLVQAGAVQSLMVSETVPGYGEIQVRGEAPTDPIAIAFGFDALKKRHNFAVTNPSDEDDAEQPAESG